MTNKNVIFKISYCSKVMPKLEYISNADNCMSSKIDS